jgi:hypothetical protein
MKNLQELQSAVRLLDLVGANSNQYVFISKEDYETQWGWIEKNNYGYSFSVGTPGINDGATVTPLGTLTSCGYTFIFIDPSTLIVKELKTGSADR